MIPKEPQMSEGDKLERANNTLLPNMPLGKENPTARQKAAKHLFERNMGEHAIRTMTVNEADREFRKDPDNITEVNADAITRARRGEPSKYRTDKDL
jgi:hypothetical protein